MSTPNPFAGPDPAATPLAAPYAQPPYGQPPYGQPLPIPQQPAGPHYGYGYPAPQPATNRLAVASLVLGILWLFWIGSVLAIVLGMVAKEQIRQRGEGGGGLATAGIVLGWVGVGIFSVFFVLPILLAGAFAAAGA